MNITLVHKTPHTFIINKPSGLVVHADGRTQEVTVVDWVQKYYPEIADQDVGEDMVVKGSNGQDLTIVRPGIVHRLDRDTSGCMVIARTQESFLHLKQQFAERKVHKIYHALVHEWIREAHGSIDVPIGKSPRDFRQWKAGAGSRGKQREAQTEYQVLGRYHDLSKTDKQGQHPRYTLVELSPKTGRTHQIRVHMKYLHHPLVSDPLYGGKRSPALGLERTALHAQSISFTDIDGSSVSASCSYPVDFQQALDRLEKVA